MYTKVEYELYEQFDNIKKKRECFLFIISKAS